MIKLRPDRISWPFLTMTGSVFIAADGSTREEQDKFVNRARSAAWSAAIKRNIRLQCNTGTEDGVYGVRVFILPRGKK